MIVLISLVFIALAVGAFTTDLPFGQQLVGAYLFLSIGAVAATATRSGLLLLFGRGTTVRVEHLDAPGPGAHVVLGRPVRSWQLIGLAVWGLGWWAVAADVAITGAGLAESPLGRLVTGLTAAGFGALVLVGARTLARRPSTAPSLLLTPTGLSFAAEQIPWVEIDRIGPVSGHRMSRAKRTLLEVRWDKGEAAAVLGAPTVADRDRLVDELRRLLRDPELRAASASRRYAADLAARLSARH